LAGEALPPDRHARHAEDFAMQSGQHITPAVRLLHTIGKGGMGSVWVADHLGLSTRVAVKFLSPAFAQDQSAVERFRREATAAAQIKSPHVSQVFDHGIMHDGTPYIVMELLEGEDLRQRLKRTGPLDLREAASIVTQVAKALNRAHQLGIVHRDIKPDNIFLLDMDGELLVKVLDFGIAKSHADVHMTATGSMVGTPLYMSPEQLLSSKHVDFRSDLWSLGVVAYRMLTGSPPFTGDTIGAISVAVHDGTFAPPSTLRPGLPPAIDAWALRALRHDPAERFGSAKQMAEELWRAVMSMGPAASDAPATALFGTPPATPPGELARSSNPSQPSHGITGSHPGNAPAKTVMESVITSPGTQRGRKSAVLVTLVALLGLGAAGVGLWLFSRSDPRSSSELNTEASPAAPAPAETTPTAAPAETTAVTDAPPNAAPHVAATAPEPQIVPVTPSASVPGGASQPAAASTQTAGLRASTTAPAKPPPASKPATSPTRPNLGY
jgi:serine/threonine-protein kinase